MRFFGFIATFALMLFMTLTAHAGFRAYNGTTDLKVAQGLTCSSGLNCVMNMKTGQLSVSVAGQNALQPQLSPATSTLTAAACGVTYRNTAATVLTLPLASTVLGCRITFVVGNASNFDVRANAADQILQLTTGVGRAARNATLGSSIMVQATAANQWTVITAPYGTWADTP